MSTDVSADPVPGPATGETGHPRHPRPDDPGRSAHTDHPPQECPTAVPDGEPRARRRSVRWRVLALNLAAITGAFGLVAAIIGGLAIGAAQRAAQPYAAGPAVASDPPIVAEPAAATPTATASTTSGRQVDPAWARRVATATGIPERALRAYASAALRVAGEQPSCGLGWNTVAAIGKVESAHGSHDGARVLASGRTTPAIRGPVLDGSGGAAIRDTDGGRLDGNATWDRAVGPLQFIPSTWKRWGTDANGDGVADPDQFDDAALTAARYLCASGSVRTPTGWRAAVFSYNHSGSYVDQVADIANQYAAVAG